MAGHEGRHVCLGVVVGAHGVRGAVRVKSFTADPADVAAYGPVSTEDGARTWPIRRIGTAKGVVLCHLDGVTDRDTAEALKGVRLCVPRAALPQSDGEDGEFYHADLIGLRVEREDGTPVGTVRAVYDFGAGDMLEVSPQDGGRGALVPFTRAAVPVVDLDGARVVVADGPGLLDADASAAGDTEAAPEHANG
ncbi:ribosome maturation factor RimM [Roseospira goensis]|uniref:Ribosome maturation factor RimM n=1 Tax=Roseospira goensis TaxID=391922 RepID=A0A7W6RZ99_9PROT|nr:ribosome maturation factor RimM [Roseospira goensis]MBB4285995.1 16S rRNA processing protein RimM [Roseospira goensis]